ncbi:MAG TPA: cytochrome c biogenesis protein CcdA [Gemmatimonadales bacterium]|jgi:thiol:disulfide interchange protein DsbD
MIGSSLDATLRHAPFAALPILFVAGLATSLTPCIYPMIPITAGVLGGAGAAGRSRRRTWAITIVYVLGLALVYASLGLVAGLSGSLFGTISANRWANLVFANLLLLAALAMFDVIPIQAPARVLGWASRLGADSLGGAFLMGATSGLVAAPCGAPAFAAVLGWVAQTQSAIWGFICLFVFSLGLTAVLVVVGLVSGTVATLPRSGRWMLWIKRGAAVVMVIMAEYYFIKAGQAW